MTRALNQAADASQAVDGLLKSVSSLATVFLAYWAGNKILGALKSAKGEYDDLAAAWRNEGQAFRDTQETLRRQDEKDTADIRSKISQDWIERERSKVKLRPKSVRGHWEGRVFIPDQTPAKPGKSQRK
jgi:predicted patatin/cPLA2 family phospholipase